MTWSAPAAAGLGAVPSVRAVVDHDDLDPAVDARERLPQPADGGADAAGLVVGGHDHREADRAGQRRRCEPGRRARRARCGRATGGAAPSGPRPPTATAGSFAARPARRSRRPVTASRAEVTATSTAAPATPAASEGLVLVEPAPVRVVAEGDGPVQRPRGGARAPPSAAASAAATDRRPPRQRARNTPTSTAVTSEPTAAKRARFARTRRLRTGHRDRPVPRARPARRGSSGSSGRPVHRVLRCAGSSGVDPVVGSSDVVELVQLVGLVVVEVVAVVGLGAVEEHAGVVALEQAAGGASRNTSPAMPTRRQVRAGVDRRPAVVQLDVGVGGDHHHQVRRHPVGALGAGDLPVGEVRRPHQHGDPGLGHVEGDPVGVGGHVADGDLRQLAQLGLLGDVEVGPGGHVGGRLDLRCLLLRPAAAATTSGPSAARCTSQRVGSWNHFDDGPTHDMPGSSPVITAGSYSRGTTRSLSATR